MSIHQSTFVAEKPVPSSDVLPRGDQSQTLPVALPEAPPVAAAEVTKKPARNWRKLLLAAVSAAALAGAADFGWTYWTVGRFEVATDDAYIRADNTTIAPKVPGYIAAVLVGDNEPVKAGQVLARIDDRDFRVGVEQARAEVEAAEANIVNKQAALSAQFSTIAAAKATIVRDEATAAFAAQDDHRYAALAKTGYGSVQNAQGAAARIAEARAAIARDTAVLEQATRQLDVIRAELAQAKAALSRAKAAQDQAELNLSYTVLTAPIDGLVGNRTLRVGQYVQAGTQLMAVVPTDAAYIVANYKETQLTHVQAGQRVTVEVDTFPGMVFTGHVDSLSPASGLEFALLPPDNATGNFTKIVQRVPVKIVLDDHKLAGLLRPGMSAEPVVNTKATVLAERDAKRRLAADVALSRANGS